MSMRFVIGEFEIETATRRLRRGAASVHLANRPFQVLLHLVVNRDRLVTRTELLDRFWDGREVYEDALTRCLSSVRKALGDQDGPARYIETRWTEGYRFIGPCHEVDATDATASVVPAGEWPARNGRRQATFARARGADLVERLMQRGNAYLAKSGRRSHRYALELYRHATVLDPENARAHGALAASHALLFLHAEPTEAHHAAAIASSLRAIELDPHCAEAQLGRAQVAVMRSEHAEADAAFRQAETLDPGLFHAWYFHARGRAELTDHEGALACYSRAAEADPFDYQALALAEQSFDRLGLRADARRAARACADAAERILRRYPDDVRALSLAACVLPRLNRRAEAQGWTTRAIALEPEEPFVNFNAACVFIALGDYERALFYFSRVPLAASGNCNWIAQDPSLDPVRSHPGFTALLPALADPRCISAGGERSYA